jgi:signal transduction histidine kinase
MKHGSARNIVVRLATENNCGTLLIIDDGTGIRDDRGATQGMGLHIMNYRAAMIGGSLEVRPNGPRGTLVSCSFPLSPEP